MPVVGCFQGKLDIANGKIAGSKRSIYEYAATVRGIVKGTTPAAAAEAELNSPQPLPEPATRVYPGSVIVEPKTLGSPKPGIMAGETGSWLTIMYDGFDSGTFPHQPWVLYGDPTWGKTGVNSFGGNYSIWCAAGGLHPVNPTETPYYPRYMNSWATYGPIDLSDTTIAQLTFKLSCRTTPGRDYIYWLSSTDGINYAGYRQSAGDGTWSDIIMDLSEFGGCSQVWFAFNFTSDGTQESLPGAFIDNVEVREYTDAPLPTENPVITSIDPPKASAGTSTPVTITGQNFGPRNVNSRVDFFFQDIDGIRLSINADSIITWTDTRIICEVPAYTLPNYAEVDYPGSAGSGPVTVTTSVGTSNAYEFDVSFSYGGMKWTNNPPIAPYTISTNFPGNSAIQSAASAWSNCGSLFSFLYGGTSSTTPASGNSVSEISWGTCDRPDIIAQNQAGFDLDTGKMDYDIIFNDQLPFSSTGAPDTYDFQTITIHELGHSLVLRDLYGYRDSNKVMFGTAYPGLIKRNLSPEDIAGIKWIYQSGSIGEMKQTGGLATLYAKPVTAAFGDCFYIEEPNRSAGIMVDSSAVVDVDDLVSVNGPIVTNSLGEKTIDATVVDPVDGSTTVYPVGMNVLAATQDLPEGMLIRCFGKVEFVPEGSSPDYFYLNDGSPVLPDGSGHMGLKVLLNGVAAPIEGTFVVVTGIRTRDLVEEESTPVLKVRTDEDID
jgi:hypothetical protein